MYDSKHRMIYLSNVGSEPVKYRFSGVYEKLLCKECEEKINEHETYVINKFTNPSPINYFEDDKVIIYGGLDYLHFRLFALSILWRASISNHRTFNEVDIGKNEVIIRKMILEGNAKNHETYPFLMAAITTNRKQTAFDLVTNPELIKVDDYWSYRFVFGGFVWLFLFGDVTNFYMKNLFFQKDGSIIIPKKDMEDIEFLVQFGFELHRQGKLSIDITKLKR